MWQRFTEDARRAIFFSQDEAIKMGVPLISPEILLLGLLRELDSTGVRVLEHFGARLDLIRNETKKNITSKGEWSRREMTLSPQAKQVIEFAYQEARSLQNNYLGTEHLLLGLLGVKDSHSRLVLAKFGITADGAREVIRELQDHPNDFKSRVSTPPQEFRATDNDKSHAETKPESGQRRMLWQRFTENARKVVFYAAEEAQRLGDSYVSTEHLLLGLIRESDGVAIPILDQLGVNVSLIRAEIEKAKTQPESNPISEMTLTPRGKRVIELALDEAQGLNSNYIGSEHLLLGLIREGDGLAGRILEKLGSDLEKTRQLVSRRLKTDETNDQPKEDGLELSNSPKLYGLPTGDVPSRDEQPQIWQRFSDEARRSIYFSLLEAQRLCAKAITPEHLLLGLVHEAQSGAAQVLNQLGVSVKKIRMDLHRTVEQSTEPSSEDILFTAKAKGLLDLAWNEAQALGGDSVGTEHLLLCLIRDGECEASLVLAMLGVRFENAQKEVQALKDK